MLMMTIIMPMDTTTMSGIHKSTLLMTSGSRSELNTSGLTMADMIYTSRIITMVPSSLKLRLNFRRSPGDLFMVFKPPLRQTRMPAVMIFALSVSGARELARHSALAHDVYAV